MKNMTLYFLHILLVLFLFFSLPLSAASIDESQIKQIIYLDNPKEGHKNIRKILYDAHPYGADIMPVLAKIHAESNEEQRALIARIFNGLRFKSKEAEAALMRDIHTENQTLRIQTQYALGRVSDSVSVVDALLSNMENDSNAFFRDKAACALAYDQVHLNEKQKVHLFDGLIDALDSSNPQVRDISIKALQIQTGQTKNFSPNADHAAREQSIEDWEHWLDEYRENL